MKNERDMSTISLNIPVEIPNSTTLNLDELKEHYQRGGLGDGTVKKFLNEILQSELRPIRERREEFQKDLGEVFNMLKIGSEQARCVAANTLDEVKSAMGINYFKENLLIK